MKTSFAHLFVLLLATVLGSSLAFAETSDLLKQTNLALTLKQPMMIDDENAYLDLRAPGSALSDNEDLILNEHSSFCEFRIFDPKAQNGEGSDSGTSVAAQGTRFILDASDIKKDSDLAQAGRNFITRYGETSDGKLAFQLTCESEGAHPIQFTLQSLNNVFSRYFTLTKSYSYVEFSKDLHKYEEFEFKCEYYASTLKDFPRLEQPNIKCPVITDQKFAPRLSESDLKSWIEAAVGAPVASTSLDQVRAVFARLEKQENNGGVLTKPYFRHFATQLRSIKNAKLWATELQNEQAKVNIIIYSMETRTIKNFAIRLQ